MERREVHGRCYGLARGFYDRFFLVQRTLFPFGLISKFKVSEVGTAVSVLPELDHELFETLLRELKDPSSGRAEDRDFYTHRPLNPRDSRRSLDWKKNAGKTMDQWVVKTYYAAGEQADIAIRCDWKLLFQSPSEKSYEAFLSRVRSVAEACAHAGTRPVLEIQEGSYRIGLSGILDFLMRLPRWHQSTEIGEGQQLPVRSGRAIIIGPTDHHWSDR
jgi:uncharacterized protein (DUF58 family)